MGAYGNSGSNNIQKSAQENFDRIKHMDNPSNLHLKGLNDYLNRDEVSDNLKRDIRFFLNNTQSGLNTLQSEMTPSSEWKDSEHSSDGYGADSTSSIFMEHVPNHVQAATTHAGTQLSSNNETLFSFPYAFPNPQKISKQNVYDFTHKNMDNIEITHFDIRQYLIDNDILIGNTIDANKFSGNKQQQEQSAWGLAAWITRLHEDFNVPGTQPTTIAFIGAATAGAYSQAKAPNINKNYSTPKESADKLTPKPYENSPSKNISFAQAQKESLTIETSYTSISTVLIYCGCMHEDNKSETYNENIQQGIATFQKQENISPANGVYTERTKEAISTKMQHENIAQLKKKFETSGKSIKELVSMSAIPPMSISAYREISKRISTAGYTIDSTFTISKNSDGTQDNVDINNLNNTLSKEQRKTIVRLDLLESISKSNSSIEKEYKLLCAKHSLKCDNQSLIITEKLKLKLTAREVLILEISNFEEEKQHFENLKNSKALEQSIVNGSTEDAAKALQAAGFSKSQTEQMAAGKTPTNIDPDSFVGKITQAAGIVKGQPLLLLAGLIGSIMFIFGKKNAFTKGAFFSTLAVFLGPQALKAGAEIGKIFGIDIEETFKTAQESGKKAASIAGESISKGSDSAKEAWKSATTDHKEAYTGKEKKYANGVAVISATYSGNEDIKASFNDETLFKNSIIHFGDTLDIASTEITTAQSLLASYKANTATYNFPSPFDSIAVKNSKGEETKLSSGQTAQVLGLIVSDGLGLRESGDKTIGEYLEVKSFREKMNAIVSSAKDATEEASKDVDVSGDTVLIVAGTGMVVWGAIRKQPKTFITGIGSIVAGTTGLWEKFTKTDTYDKTVSVFQDTLKKFDSEIQTKVDTLFKGDDGLIASVKKLIDEGKYDEILSLSGDSDVKLKLQEIAHFAEKKSLEAQVKMYESNENALWQKLVNSTLLVTGTSYADIMKNKKELITNIDKLKGQITSSQAFTDENEKANFVDTLEITILKMDEKILIFQEKESEKKLEHIKATETKIKELKDKRIEVVKRKSSATKIERIEIRKELRTIDTNLKKLGIDLESAKKDYKAIAERNYEANKETSNTEITNSITGLNTIIRNINSNLRSDDIFSETGALSTSQVNSAEEYFGTINSLIDDYDVYKEDTSMIDSTMEEKIASGEENKASFIEHINGLENHALSLITLENFSKEKKSATEKYLSSYRSLLATFKHEENTLKVDDFDKKVIEAKKGVITANLSGGIEDINEVIDAFGKDFIGAVPELKKTVKGRIETLANVESQTDAIILAEIEKIQPIENEFTQADIDGFRDKTVAELYIYVYDSPHFVDLKNLIKKRYDKLSVLPTSLPKKKKDDSSKEATEIQTSSTAPKKANEEKVPNLEAIDHSSIIAGAN